MKMNSAKHTKQRSFEYLNLPSVESRRVTTGKPLARSKQVCLQVAVRAAKAFHEMPAAAFLVTYVVELDGGRVGTGQTRAGRRVGPPPEGWSESDYARSCPKVMRFRFDRGTPVEAMDAPSGFNMRVQKFPDGTREEDVPPPLAADVALDGMDAACAVLSAQIEEERDRWPSDC